MTWDNIIAKVQTDLSPRYHLFIRSSGESHRATLGGETHAYTYTAKPDTAYEIWVEVVDMQCRQNTCLWQSFRPQQYDFHSYPSRSKRQSQPDNNARSLAHA